MSDLEKQTLIDNAIEQIKEDVKSEDFTAIEELLNFVPTENLKDFLSENLKEKLIKKQI